MEIINHSLGLRELVKFCFQLVDTANRGYVMCCSIFGCISRESNSQTHHSETRATFHRLIIEVMVEVARLQLFQELRNKRESARVVNLVQEEDALIDVTGDVTTLIRQTVVADNSSSKTRNGGILGISRVREGDSIAETGEDTTENLMQKCIAISILAPVKGEPQFDITLIRKDPIKEVKESL